MYTTAWKIGCEKKFEPCVMCSAGLRLAKGKPAGDGMMSKRGPWTTLAAGSWLLLWLTGLSLILAGLFAVGLGATRHFLPHEVAYLGMTPDDLCAINECRIVHFMIHDRVSFGGALIAIGVLYLWLGAGPLRAGEPWAWRAFVLSGLVGFSSFFLYLGYGYFDTWHAAATAALLLCFALGLLGSAYRGGRRVPRGEETLATPRSSAYFAVWFGSWPNLGRLVLLITAGAIILGGFIVAAVGTTWVFVPQDLEYMGITSAELHAVNPRLVPLIAHDRAGFGGAVCCYGLTMFLCVWCGRPSRTLWLTLAISGLVGFGAAIGIHPLVGYNDFTHLAPAWVGASLFVVGMGLTCRRWM
jgi:hypothetical protein